MRQSRLWHHTSAALCFVLAHACSLSGDLNELSAPGGAGAGGAAGAAAGAGGVGGAASGQAGGPAAGAAGAAGGGDFVVSDRGLEGEFGAGVFEGTAWAGDHLSLSVGQASGRFVSRVFDAGAVATWGALRWEPGAPYRKPLPDAGGQDALYRQGAVSMVDNVLLLHFDEAGSVAGKLAPTDASGQGHPIVVAGSATATTSPLGLSLDDDLGGYIFTSIDAASPLNFDESDFSWALWVKTTQACPPEMPPAGNRVLMGADGVGAERTHLWLGCTSSVTSDCPNDGFGHAGGTFCSRLPSAECVSYCGRTAINDGAWHHLAVVKRGQTQGALRLYVDGKPDLAVAELPFAFEAPVRFDPGIELAVGAFSQGTFPAAGAFDEVAVWRRALGDDEVASIYRRGALGLGLRVRVCSQPDCSDAEFFGPAGGQSAYLDAAEGSPMTSPASLRGLPQGRYVQYEATFTSTAPGASPELYAVELFASRR